MLSGCSLSGSINPQTGHTTISASGGDSDFHYRLSGTAPDFKKNPLQSLLDSAVLSVQKKRNKSGDRRRTFFTYTYNGKNRSADIDLNHMTSFRDRNLLLKCNTLTNTCAAYYDVDSTNQLRINHALEDDVPTVGWRHEMPDGKTMVLPQYNHNTGSGKITAERQITDDTLATATLTVDRKTKAASADVRVRHNFDNFQGKLLYDTATNKMQAQVKFSPQQGQKIKLIASGIECSGAALQKKPDLSVHWTWDI